MRIISQDGMYDFPYDNIELSVGSSSDEETFFIFFKPVNYDGISKAIAAYSSEEKAEKAMEMVRAAYKNYVFSINILSEESLKQFANIYLEDDFNKNIANPYFRFPNDENLEV